MFEDWVRQQIKRKPGCLWCKRCRVWWNNDGLTKGRCLKCGSPLVGVKNG